MPELTLHSIAFLGTGLMGAPMAMRLLQAGHAVTVWNRSAAKTEPLAALGAAVAATPAAAVHDAQYIITMLDAGPIVALVLEQAKHAIAPDALVIDMSSTGQAEAIMIAEMLGRAAGGFIDAPVSGGVIGAQQGSLAIMAGASQSDFDRAEPILRHLGRPTRVGEIGCGQLAKLCNQLIVGGTIAIVAEALLLAQSGGADPAAVRAAIRGGFAESRILEVHGQRMLERNFMPGGQVKSQAKDMDNILSAATANGLVLPVSELVTALYHAILPTLPGADQAAALLALEQRNPGKRVGHLPDRLPDAAA
jgi:3-hydroxyisobutyrate dehydrogenase-like beta-hydroxyacid dehydrogenase